MKKKLFSSWTKKGIAPIGMLIIDSSSTIVVYEEERENLSLLVVICLFINL